MALADDMKVALAETFALYLKAHNYHWNVEGPHFSEYHAFLNGLYDEVWLAVDAIAEHIRTLDTYVPGSFSRYKELSSIEDETKIPNASTMMTRLEADNKKLIATLTKAQKSAEEAGKVGIANFFQDRIDIHEKWGWQLRSFTKGSK